MTKVLSRDAIQRMISQRGGSTTVSGGGGEDSVNAAWVEGSYVAKNYWNQLFTIHGKQTTTVDGEVTDEQDITFAPNAMPSRTETTEGGVTTVVETTITRIEALFDFNSVGGISALGYNPGGGGGGGADLNALLASINNSAIGSVAPGASNVGKCLVWTSDGWAWGTTGSGGGGTVTAITAGTGLSGGTITTSGTISISNEYQTRIANGQTAYGWGNHADAGYATQQWVNQQGFLTSSAISDMATQTWVGQQGFLTSSAISDMATQTWVNQQGFVKSSGVTSVGLSMPTGFSVSGSPITSSGTLSVAIDTGYFLPTTTQRTTWDGKQDAISDLSTIRTNASHGETAYNSLSNYLPLAGGTMTGALHLGSASGASPYIYWGDGTYVYIGEDSDDHMTIRGARGVNILTDSGYDLEWNGDALATQTWVNDQGFVKSSGVTSVATGTGLTGGTITTSGTISINSTYQTYISHGETAYGWGDHADQGYLKKTEGMVFGLSNNYVPARFTVASGAYDDERAAKAQGDGYIEWWSTGGYFNHEMGWIRAKGDITIGTGVTDTTHYLQIGGGRLCWDNTNKALYVQQADGSAAHFYATGGVSALGMSGGGSPSLNTLTVGTLDVTGTATLGWLTVGGVAHFDDDITINVGGVVRTLDTEMCVQLGILV